MYRALPRGLYSAELNEQTQPAPGRTRGRQLVFYTILITHTDFRKVVIDPGIPISQHDSLDHVVCKSAVLDSSSTVPT